MNTSLLLLSTCGASVLTNQADPKDRDWLTKIANQAKLSETDKRRLDTHLDKSKRRLLSVDAREGRKLSAELNGIAAVLERWGPDRVQHLLIHTDTAVGRAAASLIEGVLKDRDQPVQLLTAAGLQADHFPSFREALADLTKQLEEWIPEHRQKGWTTIFNLTGGFKSVNAYLQAFGMLYADRCAFLFESASTLMEIPRLPVRLAEVDEIRPHAFVFRRLEQGYSVEEQQASNIPDALLLVDDGQVTTSVWGDVVWGRVRKTLLGERLLEPLSPKLIVSNAVRKVFEQLGKDRRVQVNEALDALSAHLDLNRNLPKSNTLKRLVGNPTPPATHELYLWSDGAAWRLFGHFESDRFVADFIKPHL